MVEFVFINSFRNHDSLFYPKKNQKSIPGISLKMALPTDFNIDFKSLSPIILLYYLLKYLIITGFLLPIIRYISKFFSSSNKTGQKNFNSRSLVAESCHYFFCAALKCDKFVNRSEPAAVFGFAINIKVGEFKVPKSAAAGSLFCFLPQSSQRAQRKERQFIGNWEGLKVRSLVISHWSLGGGVVEMLRYSGMIAWLHGCMVTWFHGCMGEKMKGRRIEDEKTEDGRRKTEDRKQMTECWWDNYFCNFGIVIWNLFVICYLYFVILYRRLPWAAIIRFR